MKRTVFKGLAIAVAAAVALDMAGIGVGDLIGLAGSKAGQAAADTDDLMSGRYQERVAERLREQVPAVTAEPAVAGIDGEMQRELAAERQRFLEERARALEAHAAHLAKGDVESLKKQVAEQARRAGGDR